MATTFEMDPFTTLCMAHKPSRTFAQHIFGITLPPVAALRGCRTLTAGLLFQNAPSVPSQQAALNQLTFTFLLRLLKGPLWTVFITQNQLCPADPLSGGILLLFFFLLPWKIFDVCMFLLETVPRVTGVKGPVLFAVLCNWESAETEKVLKENDQKNETNWSELAPPFAKAALQTLSEVEWHGLGFATESAATPSAGKSKGPTAVKKADVFLEMKRQRRG